MVYEFPELQGVMGRYYALEAEEDARVADAIRDHYKPQGPSDAVPSDPVGIAVALADKLDTLVGFWAIDEKPTGSKDPFALRRAALGVVRIVLENEVRLGLLLAMAKPFAKIHVHEAFQVPLQLQDRVQDLFNKGLLSEKRANEVLSANVDDLQLKKEILLSDEFWQDNVVTAQNLLAFFADRLKQYLRDQGQRHDLIDAVFALGEDDLVLIVKRVEALAGFLDSADGTNLLAGYKRAANILRAEEKKDKRAFDGAVDESQLDRKSRKGFVQSHLIQRLRCQSGA